MTPEQLKQRKQHIGASDVPAIFGEDAFRSAADLWLEKTGQVDDFEGNEATERGNLLESAVLDWAEKKLGQPIGRGVRVVNGIIAANADAVIPDTAIVEAKTTTMPDEWGDEGTDQVPARVLLQAHAQLFAFGPPYKTVYVPVLMPLYQRFEFRMYEIQRKEELCELVNERATEFWNRFVVPRVRPDDYRPSLEVLKRMKRVPNKVVEVHPQLIAAYNGSKDELKKAKKNHEYDQAALLAAMGDADGATCEETEVTYLEYQRKGYTVEPTSYRQLKIKQPKGAK